MNKLNVAQETELKKWCDCFEWQSNWWLAQQLYNGQWLTYLFIRQITRAQVWEARWGCTKGRRHAHTHAHTHWVGESPRNVCYASLSWVQCSAWRQQLGPFMLVLDRLIGMQGCSELSVQGHVKLKQKGVCSYKGLGGSTSYIQNITPQQYNCL